MLDSPVQFKEETALNFMPNTIDLSKVQTLLYHFPDGKVLRHICNKWDFAFLSPRQCLIVIFTINPRLPGHSISCEN